MKNVCLYLMVALLAAETSSACAESSFVNGLEIPGEATDLSTIGEGANRNRFGHFSDLYYQPGENIWYALSDRGPGGGVLDYQPRLSKFTLDVDPTTGAIRNFQLQETILFKQSDGVSCFTGLRPDRDKERPGGADNKVLGRSLDPEGLAVDADGNLYVSDEYGPSVYKFNSKGVLQSTFSPPANLVPRDSASQVVYSSSRKSKSSLLVSGRQDNRGFEGLAISPNGDKLYAMLQDPLADEGDKNDGCRGRHLRMVEFDVSTGTAERQFFYTLEDIAEINARIPGQGKLFKPSAQGRNIGISAIVALSPHEFLVLERDNRGIGVDDPVGVLSVGSKRIYKIDISQATDVSQIRLAGTVSLPDGVVPVRKKLFLDLQA